MTYVWPFRTRLIDSRMGVPKTGRFRVLFFVLARKYSLNVPQLDWIACVGSQDSLVRADVTLIHCVENVSYRLFILTRLDDNCHEAGKIRCTWKDSLLFDSPILLSIWPASVGQINALLLLIIKSIAVGRRRLENNFVYADEGFNCFRQGTVSNQGDDKTQ